MSDAGIYPFDGLFSCGADGCFSIDSSGDVPVFEWVYELDTETLIASPPTTNSWTMKFTIKETVFAVQGDVESQFEGTFEVFVTFNLPEIPQ